METNTQAVDSRLSAHFASLRAASLGAAARHGAAHWQLYAAAAGSALAMATSASAGVIYSDASVTAKIAANLSPGTFPFASAPVSVDMASGKKFFIGVGQGTFSNIPFAAAGVNNSNNFHFDTTGGFVKRFSSGKLIDSGNSVNQPDFGLATQPGGAGWAPGQPGIAGFAFSTLGPDHQIDHGWVRLEYTEVNGLANSLTAIDWAYDPSGDLVSAGEGAGTPEPSTNALAILAAGAAGIGFLRRRKTQLYSDN